MLVPVLPTELERRKIDTVFAGIIIGSYSAAYFISPLITPSLYAIYGRRKTALIGFLLLGASLFCYALSYFIPVQFKAIFTILSCIIRIS